MTSETTGTWESRRHGHLPAAFVWPYPPPTPHPCSTAVFQRWKQNSSLAKNRGAVSIRVHLVHGHELRLGGETPTSSGNTKCLFSFRRNCQPPSRATAPPACPHQWVTSPEDLGALMLRELPASPVGGSHASSKQWVTVCMLVTQGPHSGLPTRGPPPGFKVHSR